MIITSDWKLERIGPQTYGMCMVKWNEPFQQYDFDRGFLLPNPTNIRVAAQSMVWALEAVSGCDWLVSGEDTIVIATKNKLLHDLLTMPDKIPRWCNTGRWPKSQIGVKALGTRCYNLMKQMNVKSDDFVTLVYIEREEGDEAVIDLDEHRTEDGFDMEGMSKNGATKDEIEEALQETRMRGVMAQKLKASGARCYRSKPH